MNALLLRPAKAWARRLTALMLLLGAALLCAACASCESEPTPESERGIPDPMELPDQTADRPGVNPEQSGPQ